MTSARHRAHGARRAARTALAAGVLTAALAVVPAAPATAHDRLVSTDPADGSTVTAAPAAVTLVFSENVLNVSPTVVVTGPAGDLPVQVAVDGTTVTATLTGDQPNGAYAVTWRVVSSDGHPVQGTFGYALAAPEPTPSPSPTPTPTAAAAPSPTPPSTAASPSAAPSPEPSSAPSGGSAPSTGSTAAPLVVALAALAAVLGAGVLWARRRASRRNR